MTHVLTHANATGQKYRDHSSQGDDHHDFMSDAERDAFWAAWKSRAPGNARIAHELHKLSQSLYHRNFDVLHRPLSINAPDSPFTITVSPSTTTAASGRPGAPYTAQQPPQTITGAEAQRISTLIAEHTRLAKLLYEFIETLDDERPTFVDSIEELIEILNPRRDLSVQVVIQYVELNPELRSTTRSLPEPAPPPHPAYHPEPTSSTSWAIHHSHPVRSQRGFIRQTRSHACPQRPPSPSQRPQIGVFMPFAYANRSTCPKRRKNGLSGHFQGFDNSVAHVYPSRRLLMFDGFRRHHLRRRHAHPGICVNPRPAGIAGIGAMIVSITINAHRCRPQTAFVAQFTTGVRATVRHIPETGVQSETNADATMRSHVRESKPSLTGSTGTEQPRRPGRGPRSGTAPEKFRPYPSSTPLLGALPLP